MKLNYYKLTLNADGYIIGFNAVPMGTDYDYYGQMSQYPEATHGWTKFIDGQFVVDEIKKAEILAEEQRKAEEPTWQERIDAQVLYTALLTNSLLEE